MSAVYEEKKDDDGFLYVTLQRREHIWISIERSLAGYFVSLLLIISPSISYLLISYMHYFSKNLMCTENIKIMYIKSQNLLSHDLIVFLIDFHSISRHNMMP